MGKKRLAFEVEKGASVRREGVNHYDEEDR